MKTVARPKKSTKKPAARGRRSSRNRAVSARTKRETRKDAVDAISKRCEETARHLAGDGEGPGGPLYLDIARLATLYDMARPGDRESVEHAIASTLVMMLPIAKVARSGYEFRAALGRSLDEAAAAYLSARYRDVGTGKPHVPKESVLYGEKLAAAAQAADVEAKSSGQAAPTPPERRAAS